MNKILIIDDRVDRKKQFLNEENIQELSKYVDFKESFGNDSAESIEQEIDGYKLVAIHRSWLLEIKVDLETLEAYFEDNNQYLVLFSGGIDQKLIQSGCFVQMNSADFYTKQLIAFAEEFAKNDEMSNPLARLLYGESWQLSLWTDLRQDYWKYGNDMTRLEEFGNEAEQEKDKRKAMIEELKGTKDIKLEEWNVQKITGEIEKLKYKYCSI